MENLSGVVRLVDKEFGEMVQNGKFRSKDDVELVYKMMDIVKDAYCIWNYESEMEDGYSEYGNYPYENSYARGRSMKRNSMGQFTSREGNTGYRGGSSYNNSYNYGRGKNYSRANAKEEYIDNLREMMDNAPNEQMRNHFQRMIDEMMEQ